MDSPRGRIYQMVQVAEGRRSRIPTASTSICVWPAGAAKAPVLRACSTAGWWKRRAPISKADDAPLARARSRELRFPPTAAVAGRCSRPRARCLYVYQVSGLQRLLRVVRDVAGPARRQEALAPPAEIPFFFRQIGQTFPAEGERKYRVAMMAGCIANISFARLNEATVRVLQKNGCEVVIPAGQTCCGALHVHAGIRDEAAARQAEYRCRARRRIRRRSSPTPPAADRRSRNTTSCWNTIRLTQKARDVHR